jgi:hypothetical protein
MTQEEFADRIVAMQDTLYRISTTILPQLCDREDGQCFRSISPVRLYG